MKIICLNLNGFRSACKSYNAKCKKITDACLKEINFHSLLFDETNDVICIQETKLNKTEEISECIKLMEEKGWKYYEFSHSKSKKGYSGVSILSRHPISSFKEIKDINNEGRLLRCNINKYSIYSCYVPRIESIPSPRMSYKKEILKSLKEDVLEQKENNMIPIVTGDFNTSLSRFDMHNWDKLNPTKNGTISYEERDAMENFMEDCGLVDSFRKLHERKVKYSFFRYPSLREQNKGWRIDYILVPRNFLKHVKDSNIDDKILISDHSVLEIKF